MIPPSASLVKYDNPVLVSKSTEKKTKVNILHKYMYMHVLAKPCNQTYPLFTSRPAHRGLASSLQWQLWVVVVPSLLPQKESCPPLRLRRISRQRKSSTPSFLRGSGVRGASSGCSVYPVPQPLV